MNLDELIDKRGLPVTELATKAGVSARTLWAMRQGEDRTWRVATVAKLAKALRVSAATVRKAIEATRKG